MTGGGTIIPDVDDGNAGVIRRKEIDNDSRERRLKMLRREDDELLLFIKCWLEINN